MPGIYVCNSNLLLFTTTVSRKASQPVQEILTPETLTHLMCPSAVVAYTGVIVLESGLVLDTGLETTFTFTHSHLKIPESISDYSSYMCWIHY